MFETLSKTAKRFLRIDLELAGREIPIDDDVRERQVAAMKMDDAVLEELVDCLAKPKEEDPGNDNPYNNVSGSENNQLEVNQAEPVELKKEPAESKRFPERSKIYEPIMVRAFPQNDAELADQLEVSLAVWLKDKAAAMVLPLPALANVDRATRLIVDGSGQLWVVCGSLQESQSLLCRGLTARKWAVDHLSLIKGNFSQVKIEPVLPIGLILVSGGNLEPLRDSISQVGGIPCQILRLMFLQKDEQRSLVIV
ncbi:MAG: hypothetical protein IID32_05675 [Planctomycetes bacterium]|nr:hypothetical protein [Planctomycetota bacterium]